MMAQVMHARAGPPEDRRLVMRGQRRVDHFGGNEAGQVEPRNRVRGEDRPRYGPAHKARLGFTPALNAALKPDSCRPYPARQR